MTGGALDETEPDVSRLKILNLFCLSSILALLKKEN